MELVNRQNMERHGMKDLKIMLERFPLNETRRKSPSVPTKTNLHQKEILQRQNTSQIADNKIVKVLIKRDDILLHDYKLHLPCKVLLENFDTKKSRNVPNNETNGTFERYSKKSRRRIPTRTNTVLQDQTVQEESAVVGVKPYTNKVISNKENMLLRDHKLNLECKVMLEDFGVKTYKTTQNEVKNIDAVESCNNESNSKNVLSRAANINTTVRNTISRIQFNRREKVNDIFNEESRIPEDTLIVPTFHDNVVSSTPVKRNKKYCAELLLNNSEILVKSKQNVEKKLPIYRQHIVDNENKTDNLYEFDEIDSGIKKKIRKRRKRIPKPKDRKPVYDILKNMVKQTVSRVNKIKRPKKLQTTKFNENYDKIVEEIVQKIIDKSKISSKASEPVLGVDETNKNSQKISMDIVNRNAPVVVSTDGFLNDNTLQEKELAFDNISNENLDEDISDTEDNFEQNNSADKYFGFDSESSGTPSKINILSDITLNKNLLPKANSTMLSSKKRSPWRFSENVKRNPHYINIKRTALPCIQQDMVIDYTQQEKFLEHFSKTTNIVESSRRSPVQKSILNYVTNSSEDNNQENIIPRPSLFDYDDFNPRNTKLSDNSSNKSKRNVLGPLQDNISNNSNKSVQGQIMNKSKILDENNRNTDITYFGFDDTEEIVCEMNTEVIENRPFRFRGKIILKKNAEIVVEKNSPVLSAPSSPVAAPASPVAAPVSSTPTPHVENQPTSEDVEIKLFEDPEPIVSVTLPLKIYERKRRKRKMVLDNLENNEEDVNKKKHKKDIMTKAEEAELEKWAAKFNSVCEEIDKHELEIE